MISRIKQNPNFSVFGIILLYLIISLGSNFILSKRYAVGLAKNDHVTVKHKGTFSPISKDLKLTSKFRCILDDRDETSISFLAAVLVNVIVLFGLGFFVSNLYTPLVKIRYWIASAVPVYISNQVFQI